MLVMCFMGPEGSGQKAFRLVKEFYGLEVMKVSIGGLGFRIATPSRFSTPDQVFWCFKPSRKLADAYTASWPGVPQTFLAGCDEQ